MTITIGQVKAITHDLVLNSLADGVFNSSAGFRYMYERREKRDGGNDIGGPVIISGQEDDTTGGWYTGASTLADAEKDDITRAVVQWKQVYETILLSKLDIMKNNGSSQILNLVASKVKIAEKRMKGRLARGMFNDGSNALAFNGLQQIIAASGDYAGLSVGDIKDEDGNDAWKAYVKTSAGTLTEPLMQLALGNATEDSDRPDVAFMKQNVYNEIWGILADHQRILVDDASFNKAGHDQRKVLIYNGIPHLVDSHMKDQSIFYVNTEYTKLIVHTMEDMKAQSFKQLEDVNAVKERMLLTGNLFCNNRSRNSELAGITVVA
jgi:hypothetical protein